MRIDSSKALKKVGVKILGNFLEYKNKNYLYASLNMLFYISGKYKEEVG